MKTDGPIVVVTSFECCSQFFHSGRTLPLFISTAQAPMHDSGGCSCGPPFWGDPRGRDNISDFYERWRGIGSGL